MTIQAFEAFIESQNPEKQIDHSAWHSCALGDFADFCDIPKETQKSEERVGTWQKLNNCPELWDEAGSQFDICVDELANLYIPTHYLDGASDDYCTDEPTMYNVLAQTIHAHEDFNDLDTYGDLVTFFDAVTTWHKENPGIY